MKPTHKLRRLFLPSIYSLVISLAVTVVITAIACFIISKPSNNFLRSVFQRENLFTITTIKDVSGSLGSLYDTVFKTTMLNKVLFIIFWALIGFIVYNVVYGIKTSVDDSVTFMHELHYVHARPESLKRQLTMRFVLLFVAMLGWLTYALFLSWTIWPEFLNRIHMTFIEHGSVFNIVYAFILLLFYIHVAVILLRFTLLRARLFTGAAEG